MDKLRIGIIGTGGIAHKHMDSYKKMDDIEIIGAADIVPGKARAFLDEFGLTDVPAFETKEELLALAEQQMKEAGAFKEYTGEFWTAPETRPYMRVRYTYFDVLISCGMMHRAIDEGQRLLELCENDNLGVRYQLMHLYAYTEDEMHALALHKQFDSYEETQMLLPLAVLYYKLNQFDKAEDYIKRLSAVNKDAKKFLRAAAQDRLEDYFDQLNPFGYQPFTMEELLEELMRSSYLFDSVPYFFAWASSRLRTQTAAKKKSTGNAGRNKKS